MTSGRATGHVVHLRTSPRKISRRKFGDPAVLFIDDLRWDAFTQLSPLLRRAGVRTIRATTEPPSRGASKLLFDRVIQLAPSIDGADVLDLVKNEHLIDIQFVESFSNVVEGLVGLLPESAASTVSRRLLVTDKLATSARLRAAGVSAPDAAAATTMGRAEAVA